MQKRKISIIMSMAYSHTTSWIWLATVKQKNEALEDFKRKFQYLLDEWNAFAKLLLDSDVAENEMIDVDGFGVPIEKGEKYEQ